MKNIYTKIGFNKLHWIGRQIDRKVFNLGLRRRSAIFRGGDSNIRGESNR